MNESILIVDDEEDTATLLCDALRRRDFNVAAVTSGQACLDRVRGSDVDIVVTDVQMPRMSGVELCALLSERHPDVVPIVLTGAGTFDMAVAAMRAGASDFLMKPVKTDALEIAVRRAIDNLNLRRTVRRLRLNADRNAPIAGIVGSSSSVREMSALVREVAHSDATVLITGESGTGKELVARALHDLSPRRDEPFVAVNCAAMPAPLLESELFGHVRGAFTDAKSSRAGLFVQAGGGTILLDEIGEMPLEMQVKLLRVLQERTVRPVGGDEEVPFDVRVVTATNRDLENEVEEKRFRQDLYHRINVVAIPVPPLRARTGDVVQLAEHVLARISIRTSKPQAAITSDAARKLMDYDWPGNIRELENCLERAVAVCHGREIKLADLPVKVQQFQSQRLELVLDAPAEMLSLDQMERRYVRFVLNSVKGNKTHAARILGIDRRSLYRRLETGFADPAPVDPSTH